MADGNDTAAAALERRAQAFGGEAGASVVTDVDATPSGPGSDAKGEEVGDPAPADGVGDIEGKDEDECPFDINDDEGEQGELLDRINEDLAREVARYSSRFRAAMDEQKKKDVGKLQAAHTAEKNRLGDAMRKLQEQNFQLSERKAALERFQTNIADMYWKRNNRNPKNRKSAHLSAWLKLYRERTSSRGKLTWAGRVLGSQVKTRMFNAWRQVAQESKRSLTVRFWEAKMKKALTTYIQRYEEELGRAREQVEMERRKYRELKQTKSSMEQKMKQAFLRSVKSLNIEAFQLVNELDAPVAAIEGPQ